MGPHVTQGVTWVHMSLRGSHGSTCHSGGHMSPHVTQGITWLHMSLRGSHGSTCHSGDHMAPHVTQGITWVHMSLRGSHSPRPMMMLTLEKVVPSLHNSDLTL